MARNSSTGVSSSKTVTWSTQLSAASTAQRSWSGFTGRSGPLSARTLLSELTATTSTSPSRLASLR
ncbi:Uncharacterised protein [Mycobacteroides abscessus subsp. abscessus]|nr:Uncharacterised protein [Mycobacteroides abscessus subsp. abscessus]